MAKYKQEPQEPQKPHTSKLVRWLHGEVKSPPFSHQARQEAGMLLRRLQDGEILSMPEAEPLPVIGPRCGALRVRDGQHNWRIVYRVDADAVLIGEVYAKKTRKIPNWVITNSKRRFRQYDEIVRESGA